MGDEIMDKYRGSDTSEPHKTELQQASDLIHLQQVEIAKLKGLLSRWLDTQEITMTATFYSGMKEKYESVISDTEKALK